MIVDIEDVLLTVTLSLFPHKSSFVKKINTIIYVCK